MSSHRTVIAACRICFILATFALSTANLAAAKTFTRATAEAIDHAVLAEMQRQQVVGAAVGVILDGHVVYVQGYGQADREQNIPATEKTIFNWASNSKPLAAIAAMQLIDQRKLDLNADVRKYVPEFPDKGRIITTRHLLCHQSGIPHYSNGRIVPTKRKYESSQPYMDPVLALDVFNQSPLIFTPGERDEYSSYAYILLSAVVERAGGEPFLGQVQKRIAKKAGMKTLQLDLESQGHEDWATGYLKAPNGQIVKAPEEAHYWKHGAGGFKSDIRDFARWAAGLINHRFVSRRAEAAMWTPQTLNSGQLTERGFGFNVSGRNGLKVSHNGSQDEATTRMVLYPEQDRGVVVMTNCRHASVETISTAVFRAISQN